MKHYHAAPILLLLGLLAITPSAFAQSLPASMAYSSSILVRNVSSETSQKLLIAGNSLTQDHRSTFDLSEIPSVPDSVVRNSRISSNTVSADENAAAMSVGSHTSTSKLHRSMALLGVLGIAYIATRKRPNPRMQSDISELRNFPKKRLAHREAHA